MNSIYEYYKAVVAEGEELAKQETLDSLNKLYGTDFQSLELLREYYREEREKRRIEEIVENKIKGYDRRTSIDGNI